MTATRQIHDLTRDELLVALTRTLTEVDSVASEYGRPDAADRVRRASGVTLPEPATVSATVTATFPLQWKEGADGPTEEQVRGALGALGGRYGSYAQYTPADFAERVTVSLVEDDASEDDPAAAELDG